MIDDEYDMNFHLYLSRVEAEKRAVTKAFNGEYTKVKSITVFTDMKNIGIEWIK
jgi:hypothetical protein